MKTHWIPSIVCGVKALQKAAFLLLVFLCWGSAYSFGQEQLIRFGGDQKQPDGAFSLAVPSQVAPVILSQDDWEGVRIAADDLCQDFKRVTGRAAPLLHTTLDSIGSAGSHTAIIVGTIGHSELIDGLVRQGKIKVDEVAGKWEATLMQPVDHPFPGIDRALVIAGSDKRGTIYGIYEVSRQIGVSPWYYWADVPVRSQKHIYCLDRKVILASPSVKYRGIFLNDEAPALSGWVHEQFGGFNHQFYTKVFELLLRLKANYLWPAMWGNAFNDDDTLNPVLADQYGIVMGTSHHEPMLRAQQEWKRYGKGQWNYQENQKVLRDFWKKGIEHMGSHESIVTVGMRGDGDMPMTEGSNIALLEKIIKDQRQIITDVTGKPASKTPQLWALYKEVQEYYDKGMRVPEDITLLLCDDNWGNLRKLPALNAAYRQGGYGIYYHFDYVGDPRNYKWINTNTIERTWEQMHLAYSYGVDKIWIVNVGDLKPMEFPISFFLDYARDPAAISYDDLPAYTTRWAKQQFGSAFATSISDILHLFTKYNARVKPELLNAATYSLENYHEWDSVANAYSALAEKSRAIYEQLPDAYKAAYFQLVDFQVAASANLYRMYRAQALNHLYAQEHRSVTSQYGDSVRYYYLQDSLLTYRYNKINAGGKWNHFMDQTHIGYTYWQQPEHNSLPAVREIKLEDKALLGIAGPDTLYLEEPPTDSIAWFQDQITLYAKESRAVNYSVKPSDARLIEIKNPKGQVSADSAGAVLQLEVDWKSVTQKKYSSLAITGSGGTKKIITVALCPLDYKKLPHGAYIQRGNLVSIDALGYISDSVKFSHGIRWTALKGFGKTAGAVTPMPVNFTPMAISPENPSISYRFVTQSAGPATIRFFLSPTLNIWHTEGLKFAYAIDGEAPVIVNINKGFETETQWRKEVAASIRKISDAVNIKSGGLHTLTIWAISPGVVIQKMKLNFGKERQSFLGAPVSYYNP